MKTFIPLYINSASRRLKQRREFKTGWNWLLSMLDSSLRFYNHKFPPLKARVMKTFLRRYPRALYFRLGSSDGAVMEEIFIRKVYEPIFQFLEDAELIVDLGANVGYSIALWRERFPCARIIAVEPDSDNCQMIYLNIGGQTNDQSVSVVMACCAGTAGKVYLDRSGDACSFSITRRAVNSGEPVEAKTLLEIINEFASGHMIDLLKCDIEGAEMEVFASCNAWIHKVRYIVIETHFPYTKDKLADDIKRCGGSFDILAIGVTGGNELFLAKNLETVIP